jgi:anti-sigma factor ChrR (cupin superfamily)
MIKNPHPTTEELLAFLCDKEPLSPSAQQHLAHCPHCQQQAARYQEGTTYLLSQLYRHDCPSATTLSILDLPGAVTNDEWHRITRHLAHCPLCSSELAETRQFLETS